MKAEFPRRLFPQPVRATDTALRSGAGSPVPYAQERLHGHFDCQSGRLWGAVALQSFCKHHDQRVFVDGAAAGINHGRIDIARFLVGAHQCTRQG